MNQALGLVEIEGLSTAIVVADTMAKAANIKIVEIENTKGLGYMTIKAVGDVGAVNASVNAARQVGAMHGKLVSSRVIARPSDYVGQFFSGPEGGTEKQQAELVSEPQTETVSAPEPESPEEQKPETDSDQPDESDPGEPELPEVELRETDTEESVTGQDDKTETGQDPKKAGNSRKSSRGHKKGDTDNR